MGGEGSRPETGMEEHERLGAVKVVEIEDPQAKQTILYLELSRHVESERQVDLWNHEIEKIDDSETREVIFLPTKHNFVKSGLCGSVGVLHNEVRNRQNMGKFFSQSEMWYLLYNMIRAANRFERFKQKIGDVHPCNILINDDGQVKLISTVSFPSQPTNYDRIVQNRMANVFLAPQELNLECIAKGDYPPGLDPCKAQVFSIGLTILSSGILENCNSVYDRSSLKINHSTLNRFITAFHQKYSPFMNQIVSNMLSDVSTRRKASQIHQILSQYQNDILDLQPFTPNIESNPYPGINNYTTPLTNIPPSYNQKDNRYSGPSHYAAPQFSRGPPPANFTYNPVDPAKQNYQPGPIPAQGQSIYPNLPVVNRNTQPHGQHYLRQ